jgi:hypothetical protein
MVSHNVTCKDNGEEFKFTPKQCSYNSNDFPAASKAHVDKLFKELCYDRTSCSFPLDSTMFNTQCTSGYKNTDLVYFFEVGCSSDFIFVFGSTTLYFSKKHVGLILVSVDMLVILMLLFLLWFQGWSEEKICEEIDEAEVTASDFTVEIRGLPPQEEQTAGQAVFKCQMWRWIEELCE